MAGGATAALYLTPHSNLDFVALWAELPESIRDSYASVAGSEYWERNSVAVVLEPMYSIAFLSRDPRSPAAQNGSRFR